MFTLRRVQAAHAPMQLRPLGDPLLDPRTAAYLEPATLPVSRPTTRNSARRWRNGLGEIAQRSYPRLWAGFLFLLIMLLYLLVYAQEIGGASTPYLVVSPPDAHAVQFLVQPGGSAEPDLPMPVTGW